MFCSACGSALVPGAMHCGNCGSSTPGAAAAQPAGFDQSTQPGFDQGAYQQPNLAQPGYQQPPYGQPGYPQPNYGYQQPYYNAPASGKAIASLVLSLLGISLIGLILGYSARKEIRMSQGRISGDGMALAGIILGWIGTIGWVFIWIGIIAAASMSSSYYY